MIALAPIVPFAAVVTVAKNRLPAPWMVSRTSPPGEIPFLRMENVTATLHLGEFNDAYVGEALPQIESKLLFLLDGTPERMINV